MKKKIILIVFALLFIGVGIFVYVGQSNKGATDLFYSGTIETTQAKLSFLVPGRILQVNVQEGQAVVKNQAIAVIDRAEFEARLAQAKANLDRAQKVRWQSQAVLEVGLKTLPAEVTRAEAGLKSAKDQLADKEKDFRRYEELFSRGVITEKERDSARLAYDVAQSRQAESESLLKLAQGNLSKIDAARRDIETADAQIEVARAAMNQAIIQLDYTQMRSPQDGVVTSRNVEPGETVTAGRELITISDLKRVDLKIYVEQTQIGKVKPGQKVNVSVDSYPGKNFPGTVAFISPEGEFTPKIIQTQKERVKIVYLVKVSILNPDLELKAGMPADARLLP